MSTHTNLHSLILDEVFWTKYKHFTLSPGRYKNLREKRSQGGLPSKNVLNQFIDEDYRYITKDTRPTNEIALWLVSPCDT